MQCKKCGATDFEVTVQTSIYVYLIPTSGDKEVYGEKEQERVFNAAFCAGCGEQLSPGELTTLIEQI
jgi:hypothetical protein